MIGIYKILSPTNKVYIGQSINIPRRFSVYKALSKPSIGPKIYNSLAKHGSDNHVFEVIEECLIEKLDEREKYWKQYHLDQVNNDWTQVLFCEMYDKGGGPRSQETKDKISFLKKGQKHTEETKQKISLAKKGKVSYKKGKTTSEQTKQKISASLKGKTAWNKGLTHSDKTKKQMSEFWKGKRTGYDHPRSRAIIDIETGIEYPSLTACIKGLGKARDTVYKYISTGKLKTIKQ
jgi:group I intron endonuclease